MKSFNAYNFAIIKWSITAKLPPWLRFAAQFVNDTRGATAIILAITMSAMVGMAGLGLETGLLFSEKRHYQTAADAAAFSGAFLLAAADATGTPCYTSGGCLTGIKALGATMADNNGYAASTTPPNTITITQGNWNGSTYTINGSPLNAVRAIITEQKDPGLAGVYLSSITVGASSVAEVVYNFGGGGCVLALAKTASDAADLTGGTSVNLTNCVIAANSSDACATNLSGGATLEAGDIYTVGGYCLGGGAGFTATTPGLVPVTGGAPVPDPFASMFPGNPSMPVSCAGAANLPNGTSFSPGIYKQVNLGGGKTYTFATGTYYICGNFTTGGGATFSNGPGGATFVVSGNISLAGGSNGTLSAPASGTYPGIIFYQPGNSSNQTSFKINGGAGVTLTGALYLPGGNLTFNGGDTTGSTACLEIVAYTIQFNGGSNLTNTGCSVDGVGLINITNVALATIIRSIRGDIMACKR